MFENLRRGRQARNFTTNVPKILDLKSSFEQIFFRKLSLGAPERVRNSRDEVHERVGKSLIRIFKGPLFKMFRKETHYGFSIY